jgi:hypothetical protein
MGTGALVAVGSTSGGRQQFGSSFMAGKVVAAGTENAGGNPLDYLASY